MRSWVIVFPFGMAFTKPFRKKFTLHSVENESAWGLLSESRPHRSRARPWRPFGSGRNLCKWTAAASLRFAERGNKVEERKSTFISLLLSNFLFIMKSLETEFECLQTTISKMSFWARNSSQNCLSRYIVDCFDDFWFMCLNKNTGLHKKVGSTLCELLPRGQRESGGENHAT